MTAIIVLCVGGMHKTKRMYRRDEDLLRILYSREASAEVGVIQNQLTTIEILQQEQ